MPRSKNFYRCNLNCSIDAGDYELARSAFFKFLAKHTLFHFNKENHKRTNAYMPSFSAGNGYQQSPLLGAPLLSILSILFHVRSFAFSIFTVVHSVTKAVAVIICCPCRFVVSGAPFAARRCLCLRAMRERATEYGMLPRANELG